MLMCDGEMTGRKGEREWRTNVGVVSNDGIYSPCGISFGSLFSFGFFSLSSF